MGKCIARIRKAVKEGGGARTGGEERRGRNKRGEERIHCWEANSCAKLNGHGHTPQILVLLEWVEMKMHYSFIDH